MGEARGGAEAWAAVDPIALPGAPPSRARAASPSLPSQAARLNAMLIERERKRKAGEPVPMTLTEQANAGTLKLPFTNVK